MLTGSKTDDQLSKRPQHLQRCLGPVAFSFAASCGVRYWQARPICLNAAGYSNEFHRNIPGDWRPKQQPKAFVQKLMWRLFWKRRDWEKQHFSCEDPDEPVTVCTKKTKKKTLTSAISTLWWIWNTRAWWKPNMECRWTSRLGARQLKKHSEVTGGISGTDLQSLPDLPSDKMSCFERSMEEPLDFVNAVTLPITAATTAWFCLWKVQTCII